MLLDVAFYQHQPLRQPDVVREARLLPPRITRSQLLSFLGLAPYCRLTGPQGCLVWVNGQLCLTQFPGHFSLQNGDYVKIALPPSDDLDIDIPTRTAAAACYRGNSLNDVTIWHHTTGLEPDDAVLLPLSPPGATDEFNMMQTFGAARQHPYDFDPAQVWRNALHPKWQDKFATPAWGQTLPKAAVFYLDQVVELPEDFTEWETLILQVWQDQMSDAPFQIDVVYPDPLTTDPLFAAFLIITQHLDPTKASIMMSVWDREIDAWHETNFALVVPRLTMKAHLIEIAGLYRTCLPRGQQDCTLTHGSYTYADNEILATHMGGGFALEIHRPPPDCSTETSSLEEHESVSFLQDALQACFQRLSQALQLSAYQNWLQVCSLEDVSPFDRLLTELNLPHEDLLEDYGDPSLLQISHRLEDDPAQIVRQHVEQIERLAAAERHALLWQVPPVFQQLFDLLHLAAARDPLHQGHFGVLTWYLSHAHSRRCNIPRLAPLDEHPAIWGQSILHLWRDQIHPDAAVAFYLVFPEPYDLEQTVAAHLLVVQHENEEDVAALLTLYDTAVFSGQAIRFAFSSPRIVTHQTLVYEADRAVVCQWDDVQCESWFGWDSLNFHPFIQAQNGYGFTLSVNRGPQRRVLSLDELLPLEDDLFENNHTMGIVSLVAGHSLPLLPPHIEIALPYNHLSVQQELVSWGFRCQVFLFGDHDKALCLEEHYRFPAGSWHYMYVNQDQADAQGAFLHSSQVPMDELAHMQLLLQVGYPKAVVRHVHSLMDQLFRIDFSSQEGIVEAPAARLKQPKPWPKHCTSWPSASAPMDFLGALPAVKPQRLLSSSYTVQDLSSLLTSSQGILCDFFEDPQLPSICQDAFRFCSQDATPTCDRWLIYTDGSSPGPNRHVIPDQPGNPEAILDAWAFLVVGETYSPLPGQSRFSLIGWSAQPIHYEEGMSHFLGADRLGADVAEREGLFWAALWRLGQNSSMPTVFRPDSMTTGQQAFGTAGASQHTLSFRALRGIFQALESLLPGDLLRFEHVVSHTDDPFNAFVDHAAKSERTRSYFLARQPVDMTRLRPMLPYLWMYFDRRSGLPQLTQHGFDAHAPDLPVEVSVADPDLLSSSPHEANATSARFSIAVASANVASLCHRPDGHSGRLDYLREQFKAHGLHFVGIQEARTEACSSTVGSVYRIASGHSHGHYGVELWVNLAQPFIWTDDQTFHLAASNFIAVHLDPRCLIVRLDHPHFQAFLIVAHAPQSGQSQADREHWWEHFQQLLAQHCDRHPCFLMIDANATSGPADGIHVFQNDDASSVNTDLLRDLLCQQDLCLPSTDVIHRDTHSTWTSPDGTYAKRIDYVAIPAQWHSRCTFSQVLEHFDFAKLHDHAAVGLELQWSDFLARSSTLTSASKPICYNRHAIRSTNMRTLVAQQPVPSWSTNIETHVEQHRQQPLHVLATCCPQQRHKIKKSYLTPDIWHLRTAKLQAKKRTHAANRQCKQHLLRVCFRSWCQHLASPQEPPVTDVLQPGLLCSRLKLTATLVTLDHQLRSKIAAAKRLSLQQSLSALDSQASATDILQQVKQHFGPTNPKKCGKRPAPILDNADGTPCLDAQSSLDRWINFFKDMEGGVRMSHDDLRKVWIGNLSQLRSSDFDLDVTELP